MPLTSTPDAVRFFYANATLFALRHALICQVRRCLMCSGAGTSQPAGEPTSVGRPKTADGALTSSIFCGPAHRTMHTRRNDTNASAKTWCCGPTRRHRVRLESFCRHFPFRVRRRGSACMRKRRAPPLASRRKDNQQIRVANLIYLRTSWKRDQFYL